MNERTNEWVIKARAHTFSLSLSLSLTHTHMPAGENASGNVCALSAHEPTDRPMDNLQCLAVAVLQKDCSRSQAGKGCYGERGKDGEQCWWRHHRYRNGLIFGLKDETAESKAESRQAKPVLGRCLASVQAR